MRLVLQLAIDRVGHTASTKRPRKHVGHPGEHGLGRQIGTARVDDGEHQRVGALGANVARDLQHGGAARQIEEHGHVAALQRGQGECDVVGPHDGHVRCGEQLLGVRPLGSGAAQIEN